MAHEARHQGYSVPVASGTTLAATADILRCYEQAVQEPMVECVNLDGLYTSAQAPASDRTDAIVLREDFCSTAIVANTWLALRADNVSQGVDLDLEALQDTQRKLGAQRVTVLQSPAFAHSEHTQILPPSTSKLPEQNNEPKEYISTWAEGQATARLNRRLAKKKTRALKGVQEKCAKEPRMTLLHGDVLSLPVAPLSNGTCALEAPDLVASLNYAMAYFHDRATLLAYLRSVLRSLRPHTGVFVTDMFGGPPTGEEYEDQDNLWSQFWDEPGFLRVEADADQVVLDADKPETRRTLSVHGDLQVFPAPTAAQQGTRAEWPRGRLKLVRTGEEHGGFEYWREDGPVDYATNRFRMSLSFRFSDHSWLRDVFSYDFRIWSLKELTEAMEEAGFATVRVLVLPRNDVDKIWSGSDSESDADEDGLGAIMRRTEREERKRRMFHTVNPGEKVFSSRSFATYIVARVP
ncbi:hypothetical protein MVES1_001644 [Malassezia vespertilionis]|uniref:Uncharacterized protein n=1 Tax=Malassezia vespertilionis TaxID=2020962 RepID=A0A2N1JCI7_9BASI|nr:uncharacterized protein MVES1_001644 [Malassezia vespertilionis]PKI84270.1 hypothetical protein MVES_001546 [Malassezia vespertilionis]WFD06299.1 hypothetical protein MVES1_001644 [Malassezia vespertilionis]